MERQFYVWSTMHNQWVANGGSYTAYVMNAKTFGRQQAIDFCKLRIDKHTGKTYIPVDADAADAVFEDSDAQR